MSEKFIVAANWKLNNGPKKAEEFLGQFLESRSESSDESFIFFIPAIEMGLFATRLSQTKLGWGPQNIYFKESGAYTGENSAQMCVEYGAQYALVGHSERRTLFGETDQETGLKVSTAQSAGLIPIICVGETLEERESDKTDSVLVRQLREAISQADHTQKMLIAYEPVWAIGTGKVATPEIAESAHKVIRKELAQILGDESADSVPILYGGSVKPGNATELSQQPNINGFLVGGASLEVESLLEIYNNSKS